MTSMITFLIELIATWELSSKILIRCLNLVFCHPTLIFLIWPPFWKITKMTILMILMMLWRLPIISIKRMLWRPPFMSTKIILRKLLKFIRVQIFFYHKMIWKITSIMLIMKKFDNSMDQGMIRVITLDMEDKQKLFKSLGMLLVTIPGIILVIKRNALRYLLYQIKVSCGMMFQAEKKLLISVYFLMGQVDFPI